MIDRLVKNPLPSSDTLINVKIHRFFLDLTDHRSAMLFDSDQFLLELTKLFQQQRVKNTGSLCLTMKRYDGRSKPKSKPTKKQRLEQKKSGTVSTRMPNSASNTSTDSIEYKCLVRATFGSKKLSTIVSSKDINRFQLAYANLLKSNMDTLKKKVKESKTPGPTSNPGVIPTPSSPTAGAASPSGSNPTKKTTPSKKKSN